MGNEHAVRWYTLEQARELLGANAFIALEPDDNIARKTEAGKKDELWGFDLATGQIRRGDGKFHAAGVVSHPGGWYLGAIIEEPSSDPPSMGPHIVGHIIVEVNYLGLVRVRKAQGINGEILELMPSSLSKGELDKSGREPHALIQANPQRITGFMAVYLRGADFPVEEGMKPRAFMKQSTDGRSLAAMAALAARMLIAL